MPRRARMYIVGVPYHIVQRGNNREACFLEPENYQFYLELWKVLSKRYGVTVHAYCLMTEWRSGIPANWIAITKVISGMQDNCNRQDFSRLCSSSMWVSNNQSHKNP